nr:DUF2062 domain-containing protein [Aliiroseovarius sediminis]
MRAIAEFFYPRGGWYRASRYVIYRVRRLPDPAHRISRGIAAGIFASFTPFFGLHFLTAAILSWIIRGNVLASLLATFVGNPLTFPLIAEVSVNLGNYILGQPSSIHLPQIITQIAAATSDFWSNITAPITGKDVDWARFSVFYDRVFLPYLVGCIIPGTIAAFAGYALSNPVIHAYQRRRIKKLKERYEKRLKAGPDEAGTPREKT